MFGYQMFFNSLKKNSEEKIKYGVYGLFRGNVLLFILIVILLMDLFNALAILFHNGIYIYLYLIFVFVTSYLYFSRKIGIGLTENRIVLIKYKRIGYNFKRVYEIPFEKVRSLIVKKRFGSTKVKVVFISDVGKLEKIKFVYRETMFGFPKDETKVNYKEITNKLIELEKILDKGDF